MPNIIIGLLALAFGLWGLSVWWWSVTELLRGLVPLLLLGVGFVALAAGISNVQITTVKNKKTDEGDDFSDELDSQETKKESKEQSKPKATTKTVSKATFKAEKSTKSVNKPVSNTENKSDKE